MFGRASSRFLKSTTRHIFRPNFGRELILVYRIGRDYLKSILASPCGQTGTKMNNLILVNRGIKPGFFYNDRQHSAIWDSFPSMKSSRRVRTLIIDYDIISLIFFIVTRWKDTRINIESCSVWTSKYHWWSYSDMEYNSCFSYSSPYGIYSR